MHALVSKAENKSLMMQLNTKEMEWEKRLWEEQNKSKQHAAENQRLHQKLLQLHTDSISSQNSMVLYSIAPNCHIIVI